MVSATALVPVVNLASRQAVYGKTRKEAARKLAEAMADRDKGIVVDDKNLTVGEYLDSWLTDAVSGTVPKTKNSRRTIRLTQKAAEALRSHRARQAQEKLQAGPLYEDQGLLVFAGETGDLINALEPP